MIDPDSPWLDVAAGIVTILGIGAIALVARAAFHAAGVTW